MWRDYISQSERLVVRNANVVMEGGDGPGLMTTTWGVVLVGKGRGREKGTD